MAFKYNQRHERRISCIEKSLKKTSASEPAAIFKRWLFCVDEVYGINNDIY